jgi:hypothetical protein
MSLQASSAEKRVVDASVQACASSHLYPSKPNQTKPNPRESERIIGYVFLVLPI